MITIKILIITLFFTASILTQMSQISIIAIVQYIMANTKSYVNVKIDADVKVRAAQLLGRVGLDQTTAIDVFYGQIIAEHRLRSKK